MKFELFIASRYLRAKRRQAVVGVITIISIIGVAAGVASLIIALAINNGFRQDLQDRLLGSTAHVELMRVQSDGIRDWSALVSRLEKQPHVVAASPALYEQVLISRGPRATGAVLKGVLPAYENKTSEILKTVKLGSVAPLQPLGGPGSARGTPSANLGSSRDEDAGGPEPALSEPKGSARGSPSANLGPNEADTGTEENPPIILGQEMANDLGATIGSTVLVTSPQGELTPFGLVPKYMRFKVVGIFNSGFYNYDQSWAYTRLSAAQKLFGLGDVVSVIEFKLDDLYRAGEVGNDLERAAGPGFMSTNWMEQNRQLFRALRLERVVTFITIGLIVFVAALNILISLIMMVMEKTRDIAVLVSLGARRRQVRNIFIAQGVLIGVVGTAFGLALGYFISLLGAHYHFISLSPEVYSIDYVPFAPRALDGLLVAGLALGVSFIATIYPSFAAARVLPAEALRYE